MHYGLVAALFNGSKCTGWIFYKGGQRGVQMAPSFFFFQAEDGIRDLYVTGVQTCALPICRGRGQARPVAVDPAEPRAPAGRRRRARLHARARLQRGGGAAGIRARVLPEVRSEERRVGKECRSWWTAYIERENRREQGVKSV